MSPWVYTGPLCTSPVQEQFPPEMRAPWRAEGFPAEVTWRARASLVSLHQPWVRIDSLLHIPGRTPQPVLYTHIYLLSCQTNLLIVCQSFSYGPWVTEQIIIKHLCRIPKSALSYKPWGPVKPVNPPFLNIPVLPPPSPASVSRSWWAGLLSQRSASLKKDRWAGEALQFTCCGAALVHQFCGCLVSSGNRRWKQGNGLRGKEGGSG